MIVIPPHFFYQRVLIRTACTSCWMWLLVVLPRENLTVTCPYCYRTFHVMFGLN